MKKLMIYGRTEEGEEIKLMGAADHRCAWTEDGELLDGIFRFPPAVSYMTYEGNSINHDGKELTISKIYWEWD